LFHPAQTLALDRFNPFPARLGAAELASGELVEVLPQFPPSAPPVHVLYSHTRRLSPRPRVVIDWMAEQFRSMVTP
jgi:DNA-binding transcriptional LysR family regulator